MAEEKYESDKTADIGSLRRMLAQQRKLSEASYALHSSLDLDELLELILDAAIGGVDADRGTVFLLSDDRSEIWSRVLKGDGDGEKLEIRLPLGHGIAGTVAATGETVRIDDAYEDDRFDQSWDKKSGYRTRQILCAPIRSRGGRIVGVFQLLNKKTEAEKFIEEDEAYLASLSVHAALAVENARLHRSAVEKERQDREIGLAREVQRQLQPERREVRVGGFSAAGINELCEDASGDYYDFLVELPSGRLGVAIGDVSGHGLQASLVMAEARAFLRALSRTADDDLPAAMDLLNDFLVPDMTRGRFISLFVCVIDTASGVVEWSNAGHNPPLLLTASEKVPKPLEPTGTIMGVMAKSGYPRGESVTMEEGDTLFLYTDGVTEAKGPGRELFGMDRLVAVLEEARDESPAGVLDRVREAIRDFTRGAPNHDDLTLVTVKRDGR